ncbi:MAG: YbfB/YjiJ family MFS transporter [Burkholderiaceae bacterium]|nr:YbfB/YjiJ family MFS transporter [Burkholderiaceae bacterium]
MHTNKKIAPADPLPNLQHSVMLALVLSLGAAVSLGVTRFSYGLLLPVMRADLGWSYTLAGAMNTVNALGYLLGALAMPRLLRRFGAAHLLIFGAVTASVFMLLTGFFTTATPLLIQRLLAGVASAFVFVSGGLLAAQLGAREPGRSGLLIGVYYGGTGLGIVFSALVVPAVDLVAQLQSPGMTHAWAWAWWALALGCALATLLLMVRAPAMKKLAAGQGVGTATDTGNTGATEVLQNRVLASSTSFHWASFSFALAAYGLFGVGYIGYMTFVIALLREQSASTAMVTIFYTLLGLAVMASSRIWAGLLDRYQGGQALALLNALLGCAIVIPALTAWQPALILSGVLFGGVFLSVVASTTALVRHNLPPSAWGAGISAFTIVFAAGQIVGPTMVGWIADGSGGLARGLLISALALWAGALLAWRQKPL